MEKNDGKMTFAEVLNEGVNFENAVITLGFISFLGATVVGLALANLDKVTLFYQAVNSCG